MYINFQLFNIHNYKLQVIEEKRQQPAKTSSKGDGSSSTKSKGAKQSGKMTRTKGDLDDSASKSLTTEYTDARGKLSGSTTHSLDREKTASLPPSGEENTGVALFSL